MRHGVTFHCCNRFLERVDPTVHREAIWPIVQAAGRVPDDLYEYLLRGSKLSSPDALLFSTEHQAIFVITNAHAVTCWKASSAQSIMIERRFRERAAG